MERLRHRYAAMAGALALAAVIMPETGMAQSGSQLLRLAPLQIMCIRAPCPWGEMAIRPVDAAESPHPLHRGALPRLRASPGDAAAIRRAWQRRSCLIVSGSVERSGSAARLSVARILRRC